MLGLKWWVRILGPSFHNFHPEEESMSIRRFLCVVVALALCAAFANPALSQTKLLRFPDIHKDRVVFCYAGDLWLASSAGGTATRLTTHPGQELFPKFW